MAAQPTDATFAAIVSAIAAIEADPTAPRTKAHVMRLAGIAHPTVHRAFKWDSENETAFKINERWQALTEGKAGRRSPAETAKADLKADLRNARRESAELQKQLDEARLVAAAAWLHSQTGGHSVTPIRESRGDSDPAPAES